MWKAQEFAFASAKHLDREFIHRHGMDFQRLPVQILRSVQWAGEMVLKEYQKRSRATVRNFRRQLAERREEDRAARRQNPESGDARIRRAWGKTVAKRPNHPRQQGLGAQLPAFRLEIPTGGGKTLLATRVIDRVNARFRQQLDQSSGHCTRIFEKIAAFGPDDVAENL